MSNKATPMQQTKAVVATLLDKLAIGEDCSIKKLLLNRKKFDYPVYNKFKDAYDMPIHDDVLVIYDTVNSVYNVAFVFNYLEVERDPTIEIRVGHKNAYGVKVKVVDITKQLTVKEFNQLISAIVAESSEGITIAGFIAKVLRVELDQLSLKMRELYAQRDESANNALCEYIQYCYNNLISEVLNKKRSIAYNPNNQALFDLRVSYAKQYAELVAKEHQHAVSLLKAGVPFEKVQEARRRYD